MIPLFSTSQVREIDDYAINKLGIPGLILMENAALQMFNIILDNTKHLSKIRKIGFICGKGNNGGDGFALARHFANYHYEVCVIYTNIPEEMTPDCKANFSFLQKIATEHQNILLKEYGSVKDLRHFTDCDIIVDALLGSGAKGILKEPYSTIIDSINKINSFKVAVDIPTGLDADIGYAVTSFHADLTVTLGELKKGLFFGEGYGSAGKVIKGNIGIGYSFFDKFETDEYLIEPEDVFYSLPEKKKSIHKYSAGKVLTVAGSSELPGAAVLTSNAALKIGAGASVLCFPESSKYGLTNKFPEVIVKSYNDNSDGYLKIDNLNEISERMNWADVIALGPGLGRHIGTQNAVVTILHDFNNKKFIIDADAIFALGGGIYKQIDLSEKIITPHYGEFAHLVGITVDELKKDILSIGKNFALNTGAYLILKGAPTIIFTPDGESLINSSGNPGMAKFGTGDVLTGVLAGFTAQHDNPEQAIIAGVYLHSLSSDLLLKEFTEFGFTASDIINYLPAAIKFIRNSIA